MRKLSASTRDAILSGTVELLSEHEFGEVTIRDIADSAHVAQTTLFRYFTSKEEILQGIVDELAPRFFRELEGALELVDDPRHKLLAICRQAARFAARNRGLIRVLQREVFCDRRPSEGLVKSLRAFLQRMREVCEDGIQRGVFRGDLDLEVVPMLFHSVVHAVMMLDRLRARDLSEAAFCKAAEVAYQLLLHAVTPGARKGGRAR
jgi:AcrR family transcriptional regulator